MKPVIYIDMLFLLNFLINSVTLYASSVLLNKKTDVLRLAFAAALSAIYSSVMFFPQMSILFSMTFKLIFWVLTVWIAFPANTPKKILTNSLVFLAANLILGGIIFLLIFTTDFGTTVNSVVSNGEIYLDISFETFLISGILAFFVVHTLAYIKKEKLNCRKTFAELTIHFNGKKVTVSALCDTGCSLTDPLSGAPAIIIPSKTAKILLHHNFHCEKYRILPFSTIDNKNSFIHGFIPDKVVYEGKDIKYAVVGIANTDMDNLPAVFNPALTESTKNRKAVTCKNEAERFV